MVRRLILLFLLLPSAAIAQSGVWGLRGMTKHFAVHGNRVVAADGRGVAVYDATTLQRIATAETESESLDAAFVGDGLVVLTRAGFDRFTLDPLTFRGSEPGPAATRIASNGELFVTAADDGVRLYRDGALSGFWPQTAHRITAMAWHGNALFVAVDSVGIVVLDGGSSLAQIGYIGENAIDLAIEGDTLYTASGFNGLAIYDVHDPAAAQLVSRTAADEGFFQLVAAAGGRAAVAEELKRVRLFDVSDPAAPRAFPAFAQPSEAIAMSSARLFVSGSTFDDAGIETGSGVPMRAYDVAQPDAPRVAGEVRDLAGPIAGAATDGTFAFVSDPPFFRVIDVSTTSAPREVASLRIDGIEPYVKSLGSRVILYGTGNVRFIDVSDPYRPRDVGSYVSQGKPPGSAAISSSAFIEGNTSSGFHVFDFQSDGEARFLGGIRTHPVDIVTHGDVAYYLVEWQSVGIADVNGGARAIKGIVLQGTQLAPAGDLLLVRDVRSMHVFSLADPLNPVEISAVPLDRGGVIAGDRDAAYIAMNGTILRMDLTDPTNPSLQPTGTRVVAPSQMAATAGKVVVADRYALRVFGADSAPPRPPAPLRRHAARP